VKLLWTDRGWEDYLFWQQEDKKTLKRINLLIADCLRNGTSGIGKPEPLKHDFAGAYSRRINMQDRLVYVVHDNAIEILQCRWHYSG